MAIRIHTPEEECVLGGDAHFLLGARPLLILMGCMYQGLHVGCGTTSAGPMQVVFCCR